MAKAIQVIVTCDLHGDEQVEGAATVGFGFDGRLLELDLCQQHLDEFNAALGTWADRGREYGRFAAPGDGRTPRAGGRRAPRARASGRSGESTSDVRQWARAQGMQVNDRGRIPAEVVEAYQAAHA